MSNQRPYMFINHSRTPKPGSQTNTSGWMALNEMNTNETVSFDFKLKTKKVLQSSFVIDILAKKFVRNAFAEKIPDDDLIQFYYDKYSKSISETISAYLMSMPSPVNHVDIGDNATTTIADTKA